METELQKRIREEYERQKKEENSPDVVVDFAEVDMEPDVSGVNTELSRKGGSDKEEIEEKLATAESLLYHVATKQELEEDPAMDSLLWRIRKRVAANPIYKVPTRDLEKKVEYIELFFDLIFVYSLRTINALFHHVGEGFPSAELIGIFLFLTAVVMQVWFFTTMFFNRYGRKSLRDYISIFINMYLLYFMASGSTVAWLGYFEVYHLAWALIMVNLGYRSWDKMMFAPHIDDLDRQILKRNLVVVGGELALILLAIPVFNMTGCIISPLALLWGYVVKGLEYRIYQKRPCDFPHLAERNLLLVILTFGEMIIGISAYFSNGGHIVLNLMAFLIVIGLFLAYGFFYDNVINHHLKTSGIGYLGIHVVMILAINSTTIALELLAEESPYIFPKMMWMVITVTLYYYSLILMGRYAKPEARRDHRFILYSVSLIAAYIALMLFIGESQMLSALITLVFIYLTLGVIVVYHRGGDRKLRIGGYL